MKIYVLVANKDGETTVNMPTHYGRVTRVYKSKAQAKVYARRFDCSVMEFDLDDGTLV